MASEIRWVLTENHFDGGADVIGVYKTLGLALEQGNDRGDKLWLPLPYVEGGLRADVISVVSGEILTEERVVAWLEITPHEVVG